MERRINSIHYQECWPKCFESYLFLGLQLEHGYCTKKKKRNKWYVLLSSGLVIEDIFLLM